MEEQTTHIGTLIEPDPIGFRFGAPGWTILLGILLILILIFAVKKYQEYKRNKYRRFAVSAIESLSTLGLSVDQLVFRIAEILKRVSITSYGRSEVARLNGKEWFDYIDHKNGNNTYFQGRSKEILSGLLYQGKKVDISMEEVQGYQNDSLNWIKKHRV